MSSLSSPPSLPPSSLPPSSLPPSSVPSSPLSPSTTARPRRAWPQVSHATGFWFAAVSFMTLMAFGTAPTPLWPLYQARDGFGAVDVTVAYAVLVIGAAIGFLGLGHLSDRFGRRRIVVPALTVGIAAALILAAWPELPGLLVGRTLNGVGLGLMASTATTYLHDLYQQEHPRRRDSTLPAVVATAANLGGLALGTLVGGIIAEWVPRPLTTTQVLFAAAMAVCLILTLSTPETVDLQRRATDSPNRFALRPGGAVVFTAATALGIFAFALFGVISSLGAIMLQSRLGIDSRLIAGVAPFLMFAASAVGQLLLGRLSAARMLLVGVIAFPVGLGLTVLALYHPALWLYLIAISLAGGGAGVLFKGGLGRAAAAADPGSRAGVLAVFFGLAYIGMGIPSILFGIIIQYLGMETSMLAFAVLLTAGAVVSVAVDLRAARR